MSNRRKPRNERARRRPAAAPKGGANTDLVNSPWWWAIQDVVEAETRGDAAGALAIMRRRPHGPGGETLWRPWRLTSMEQLVLLGADVPSWMGARWVLEQALQQLTEPSRKRSRTAVGVATDLLGRDDDDDRASVIDFDWVYRQLFLYDLGGLEEFLRDGATPDLLAGADRVDEWAHAPMGAYTFLGSIEGASLWLDQVTRQAVETINIGSAVRLLEGAVVIGRVVPAGDDLVFEGPPLEVTRDVARAVAADPPAWLSALRSAADQVRDGTITTFHREWRSLASDVPTDVVRNLLTLRAAVDRDVDPTSPEARARATLDLARSELQREEEREERWYLEDDDSSDDPLDDEWDAWAHLHAALLVPEVMRAMPDVVGAEDEDLLLEIRDRVAEPARSWVTRLVDRLDDAAA